MSDRYQTISEISTGPAGIIYRGWDRHQNRDVSIQKIAVNGEAAKEVLREARALYGLRHPNVVTVYEYGSDDAGVFVVREMLKGKTLDALLNQRVLTRQEFDTLVRQTLEAVHEAHTCGLIHRNLQPDTLIVPWNAQNNFAIKITDFTLGAPSEGAQPRRVESEHFVAPEQFGNAAITLRADLYSLGAVFYYSLTRRYPFEGNRSSEVMVSHLYHRLVPLSDLRPDLSSPFCAWVERLMKRESAERPATAEEALQMYLLIPDEEVVMVAPCVEEEPVALPVIEEEEPPGATPQNAVAIPPEISPQRQTEVEAGASEIAPQPRPPATSKPPHLKVALPASAEVDQVGAASPSKKAAPPRKTSALQLITIAFAVVLVGVFALVSTLKYKSQGERQQRLAALAAAEAPEGSDLDVRMLLDFLEERAHRDTAAQVLSTLRGGDYIDRMLVEHLGKTGAFEASVKLVEVIGARGVASAFDSLLPLIKNPSGHMRRAAWQALGNVSRDTDISRLAQAVDEGHAGETEVMQEALIKATEGSRDRAAASEAVRHAYQAGKTALARTVLLTVLTRVGGGPETLAVVTAAIADPAEDVRRAAIVELAKYPTHDPLSAITERFPLEPDSSCRAYLLVAARELAAKPGASSQETLARQVQSLYANARTEGEKDRAVDAISQVVAESTVSFYQTYADQADQRLRREALSIAAAFQRRLQERVIQFPAAGGAAVAPAAKAELTLGGVLTLDGEVLVNWIRQDDTASWLIQFPRNGRYEVAIYQAHAGEGSGTYEVKLAGQSKTTTTVNTGGLSELKGFVVGEFEILSPGTYRLVLQPRQIPPRSELMRVSKMMLKAL
jgi:serine/threonine protein kinase